MDADRDAWHLQRSSLASLFTEDTYIVPGLWLRTPRDFSFSIYYLQGLASGSAPDTIVARSPRGAAPQAMRLTGQQGQRPVETAELGLDSLHVHACLFLSLFQRPSHPSCRLRAHVSR